jgi:hypothetical protein
MKRGRLRIETSKSSGRVTRVQAWCGEEEEHLAIELPVTKIQKTQLPCAPGEVEITMFVTHVDEVGVD